MSTPESIVVSLEKARELKAAGWPQHCGVFYRDAKSDMIAAADPHRVGESLSYWLERFIASSTSEEILRLLPVDTFVQKRKTGYRCCNPTKRLHKLVFNEKTAADAVSAYWIYLSRHNLLPKA